MPLIALMIAAQALTGTPAAPACRPAQLRVSLDGRDGAFNGMSHAGTQLSIRNTGRDCALPALPTIQFRDSRGRVLPAVRRAPVGMHPGPVMLPLRLAGGHRATTDLRWVAGPVFSQNRSVHAASIAVRIGAGTVRVPTTAVLYGETGKSIGFEQSPLHAEEGMAAG
ncbi:DUF4232 domain-containing protein [Sphingomonas sp. H39-1-10]|uniref:DUF4232 domain-containing protein n=1 Tax=Sphingomonas pollutisoli TaxID=3030829 RepID=UPI0023B9EC9D|nr:DUF4232 domain-containing protein [Sphingomonas pollutisoli]MDF0486545.1 DUF4232 domain-containing protein [Sphingomonas pollutisoli]